MLMQPLLKSLGLHLFSGNEMSHKPTELHEFPSILLHCHITLHETIELPNFLMLHSAREKAIIKLLLKALPCHC